MLEKMIKQKTLKRGNSSNKDEGGGQLQKKFKPNKNKSNGNDAKQKFQKKFANKKPGHLADAKENRANHDGQFKKKDNTYQNKFQNKKSTENANTPPEKTDWAKFKKDKKDLKVKRKQSKDIYEISMEAKKIYEKLKCRRTEKKTELVEKLFNLFSGPDIYRKLVLAHDTARVLQCMLKFASPSLREQISERLLPLAVDMCMSKYSHFCVLRMLKYGSPATKTKLVDSLFSNIVKLSCHCISSKILDHIYLTVASNQQKIHMRQEFYGDLFKKSKDVNIKSLCDAYKDTPGMKASILNSVKSNLEHIVNKQLLDNCLVHAVLLEYTREIEDDKIEEMVTLFGPLIPHLLTTKDGCQASIWCFYKSSSKNRRAIVKAVKEHLVKISTHEHGHVFIIALLNALDDTKATKKAIYDSLHPELQTVMSNQYGRRVIEWFISPGDKNCFHPSFVASIEEGLQYGKKDKDVRRREIFEQIEGPIATIISEQPQFWLSDRHIGLVTAEILKKLSTENFVKVADALAGIVADPKWSVTVEEASADKANGKKPPKDFEKIVAMQIKNKKKLLTKQRESKNDNDEGDDSQSEEENAKQSHEDEGETESLVTAIGIEEAGMHIVLKRILKHDKERLAQDELVSTFGSFLLQHAKEETLQQWVTINRACFVLLNLFENSNEEVQTKLKQLVKPHSEVLKNQSATGAKLLYKKLAL